MAFYPVALQLAAREARQGHQLLADDIEKAVDASRCEVPRGNVTKLARPRGDLAGFIEVIIRMSPCGTWPVRAS